MSENGLFRKRPLLPVAPPGAGPQVAFMTYNMLAQGLVKRERFPGSGAALRWKARSRALVAEIAAYGADVLCLQEVDAEAWHSFWLGKLHQLGYAGVFHGASGKTHGVAVAARRAKFRIAHHAATSYDAEDTGAVGRVAATGNVALVACLEFAPEVRQRHPHVARDGVIVATTHLYWHPDACYERARQTYVLLRAVDGFQRQMRAVYGANRFYTFFGADLNSQPFDTPYLSVTCKPVRYSAAGRDTLAASLRHWSPDGAGLEDPAADACIDRLQDLHNSLALRAVSLYSLAYHLVHPENAGLDNDRNEPLFSNWAHVFTGLLDYICVVCDWDGDRRRVDDLDAFAAESGVRLLSLLRMPTEAEMGVPPCGQPRVGEYPSDHLCMIAVVELL